MSVATKNPFALLDGAYMYILDLIIIIIVHIIPCHCPYMVPRYSAL